MAAPGSMPYVNGKTSAIVIDGEIPGSAPPRIPHATPSAAAGTSGVVTSNVSACVRLSMRGYSSGPSHGCGIGMPSNQTNNAQKTVAPAIEINTSRRPICSP